MPEYLKALTVILGITISMFVVFRPVFINCIPTADFNRRRSLWLFLTICLFLSHSFWIYIIVCGFAIPILSLTERNKVAAFFFLLFAIPPVSEAIPGFGIVKFLFAIDYIRLLTLVLFLPMLFDKSTSVGSVSFPQTWADKCLLAYLFLIIVLLGAVTSTTDLARNIFNVFMDIFLPYYAASRTLKSTTRFRDALSSFVVAAAIMAPVGLFETMRSWALYTSLAGVLDIKSGFFGYLLRDGGLRATASAGHAIVLGYVFVIASGFCLYIRHFTPSKRLANLLFLLLLAGLIAPLSRGPWLGAFALFGGFVITGKYSYKQITLFVISTLCLTGAVSISPYANKVVSMIPFVGHVDDFNVSYRQLLLENCITLLKSYPFFGVPNVLGTSEMQAMKQGQGIIDIVNTYVGVALGSGLIGLSLFLGVFLSVGIGIVKSLRLTRVLHPELHLLGRVILAVLGSILLMIGTVSSIFTVPTIYWMVAGMGVAYLDLVRRTLAAGIETFSQTQIASRAT